MTEVASVVVTCTIHGPMHYRPGCAWWTCEGFDGEGCATQIVFDEDLRLDMSDVPRVVVTRGP